MTVRSKMTCNTGQTGDGVWLRFGAVYEGNTALQNISENAIFGDATPSGLCNLDPADIGPFQNGEDYYLDLTVAEPTHPVLLKRRLRLSYSTPELDRDLHGYGVMAHYRWISIEARNAHLEMGIRNPAAIDALDTWAEPWLSIVLASGRRSEAEIELRRAALAEHLTDPYNTRDRYPDSFVVQTARLERALRRSEGLDY